MPKFYCQFHCASRPLSVFKGRNEREQTDKQAHECFLWKKQNNNKKHDVGFSVRQTIVTFAWRIDGAACVTAIGGEGNLIARIVSWIWPRPKMGHRHTGMMSWNDTINDLGFLANRRFIVERGRERKRAIWNVCVHARAYECDFVVHKWIVQQKKAAASRTSTGHWWNS